MTDGVNESNIGVWFGFICVALALLPWIPLDMWLKRHGHEYITTEFKEGLQNGLQGLIICAMLGTILGIAAYHFFYQR